MFQYASLKGIARKHGYDFLIPDKKHFGMIDQKVLNERCDIYDTFDISKNNTIFYSNYPKIKEKDINFDLNLFETCPDNVDLEGYFQSYKYFEHIKKEIKLDFSFNPETKNISSKYLKQFGDRELISLHIRRGDYLHFPEYHPLCSIDYYCQALSKLPEHLLVIVFSDDPEWCFDQTIFNPNRFIISENNTPDIDLYIMTRCNYHIISNSSFSWWGAWMSNSKMVISPKKWFGEKIFNFKIEDKIPEDWLLL
jgi:hypothetical protein